MSFIRLNDPRHPLHSLSFEARCQTILNGNIDPQALFGVEDLNPQTLNQAYKHLALHFHPDKHQNSKLANITFQTLHDIYQQLLTPKDKPSPDTSNFFPFNWDEFFDTEGLPQDIADEINALKSSLDNFKLGEKVLKEFKQTIQTPDFSKVSSSKALQSKRQAGLTLIQQQLKKTLPVLQELEHKISYRPKDKKFTERAQTWADIYQRDLIAHANFRLGQIQSIEKFLFDPHTRFNQHWQALILKTQELEDKAKRSPKYLAAAQTGQKLRETLELARQEFCASLGFGAEQEKFSQTCLRALHEAGPILAEHRGIAQLIADLSLNLLIFLSTASLSFVITHQYRFFKPQTDSSQKAMALEKSLKGYQFI